jgi:hypothetical protein
MGSLRRLVPARLVAAAIALACVLLFSSRASAKEMGPVTLTGPGIATPIVLQGDDAIRWWNESRMGRAKLPEAPAIQLGPIYHASWSLPACNIGEPQPTVAQDVYPFAQGGPLVSTHPGSRCARRIVSAGWNRGTATFLLLLDGWGVPQNAPPNELGTIASAPSRRVLFTVAIVALALAALAVLLRRSLRRTPSSS